jgi:hypothetical protein
MSDTPKYARKGTTDLKSLTTEAELSAHCDFYKHCCTFANRHLQYKLTEDVNYGQIVRPSLHMYLTPHKQPPSREWQDILTKPLAIRDVHTLAQIYAKVPQYLFNTALATKKYHYNQRHPINFDSSVYTERNEQQLTQQYEDMSRHLKASLREQYPPAERNVSAYIPKPYEPDGSIYWDQVDKSTELHVPNRTIPGGPIWTLAPSDASVFMKHTAIP